MKKPNKTQILLTISIFILISVFSIAAANLIKHRAGGISLKPSKDNPGLIQMQTKVSNRYFYDDKTVYLLIDLKAGKAGAATERTPLNLGIVIDKSGSMDERNKIGYVKQAVEYIIDQLNDDDYISIVTYDTDVNVLQRTTSARDRWGLRDKVSRISAAGWTNLSGGMFEGYDQVDDSYRRGYVNRVLLLSDGLANRGITDRWRLADMVRDRSRRDGITISTFGVGYEFDENLLTDIADYGKGNYYYIRNSSDIPEIFAGELKGIRNLVGQATKVRVKFDDDYLRLNKVYGYPYEISGNEVIIDFKDVFSEQSSSVLLKFDVTRKVEKKIEFESELTYENVESNFDRIHERQYTVVEPVSSKAEYDKGNDQTVQQNIAVFEANEIMENALREADNGNYERAREQMQMGQTYMNDKMQTLPSSPLMKQQMDVMEKYNDELQGAETKSEEEKSDMQKSGKYDNYKSRKNK
jgi:Ca-activated chloride channel family protein